VIQNKMVVFDVDRAIDQIRSDGVQSYLSTLRQTLNLTDVRDTVPVMVNVFDRIRELKEIKRKLMKTYYDLYADMVISDVSAKNNKKDVYDSLVNEIHGIESSIQHLYVYLERVNEKKRNQSVVPVSSDALTDPRDIAHHFIQKINDAKTDDQPLVTYFIDKVSKVEKSTLVPDVFLTKLSLVPKTKKKELVKKLTVQQTQTIKHNIKQLIASKFKFNTKDECVSKKHSQPYFMSKENMLKVIENDNELKSLLPSNYKTLSKEQLCTYLFD
jgi:hypothetical protein